MFERYNEPARHSMFLARYEASLLGDRTIEAHHLLLGILKSREPLILHLVGGPTTSDAITRAVYQQISQGDPIDISAELPFRADAKQVLDDAAEEADRLLHRHVGPEHLLLGLLRLEQGISKDILRRQGLGLESVREDLVMHASAGMPPPAAIAGLVAALSGERPAVRRDGTSPLYFMRVLDGPSPGRRANPDAAGAGVFNAFAYIAFSTRASSPADSSVHVIGPVSMQGVTLPQFALTLEAFLDAPVIVEDTDMVATFDIDLDGEYRDVDALIAALRAQLGLELTSSLG